MRFIRFVSLVAVAAFIVAFILFAFSSPANWSSVQDMSVYLDTASFSMNWMIVIGGLMAVLVVFGWILSNRHQDDRPGYMRRNRPDDYIRPRFGIIGFILTPIKALRRW